MRKLKKKRQGRWSHPATSVYTQVKIKRKTEYGGCKLLQKNIYGKWISLGEFDTVDGALDVLVDVAERMKKTEGIRDREEFVSRYGC